MNRAFLWLTFVLFCTSVAAAADRANIVLVMTDDMGFSDIGCYGGEIETPNNEPHHGSAIRDLCDELAVVPQGRSPIGSRYTDEHSVHPLRELNDK